MTPTQRLLLMAGVGLGVTGLALYLARNASANTAQNDGTPLPGNTLDPNSARGLAATSLADAIQQAGGYQGTQQTLVRAYETAAGLSLDAGYPGAQVMSTLLSDLQAMGTSSSYPLIASITVYPWTSWGSGSVPAAFADGSGKAWTTGTVVGT